MYFLEPFTKHQAWEDLILRAEWREGTNTFTTEKGERITLSRSHVPAAREFLADRWKWGAKKVTCFLDRLEEEGRIEQHVNQPQGQRKKRITNVIAICNYDRYQPKGQREGQKAAPERGILEEGFNKPNNLTVVGKAPLVPPLSPPKPAPPPETKLDHPPKAKVRQKRDWLLNDGILKTYGVGKMLRTKLGSTWEAIPHLKAHVRNHKIMASCLAYIIALHEEHPNATPTDLILPFTEQLNEQLEKEQLPNENNLEPIHLAR